jgi:general secretion pathway protein G
MKRISSHTAAAFTLLEIMLVVMIIALLAGAAVHLMKGNIGISQDVKTRSDIKSVGTQMMVYENLNGFLPSTQQGLAALVEKPTSEPIPRNWKRMLTEIPIDPWGNALVFETPARRSKENYDLYSKGPDRLPNTDDDIGNW